MSEPSTWDDLRRIIDEIEVKMHLAGMDLRDRWKTVQPRIEKLERAIESGGERAAAAIEKEMHAVGTSLRGMRDELSDAIANRGPQP